MDEDDVDVDGDEVTTGEDWDCLEECIEGMEGKTGERCDCFGLVMD